MNPEEGPGLEETGPEFRPSQKHRPGIQGAGLPREPSLWIHSGVASRPRSES